MKRITFSKYHDKHFYDANAPPCKVVTRQLLLLLHGGFIMYEKYLLKIEEAGKIRNLKERSISCYKNYVSYFLNYVGKATEDLPIKISVIFCLQKKILA